MERRRVDWKGSWWRLTRSALTASTPSLTLKGAKLFKCDDCQNAERANPTGPPSAEIQSKKFGEVLFVDLGIFYDANNVGYVALIVVDVATSFGLGIPLRATVGVKPKAIGFILNYSKVRKTIKKQKVKKQKTVGPHRGRLPSR